MLPTHKEQLEQHQGKQNEVSIMWKNTWHNNHAERWIYEISFTKYSARNDDRAINYTPTCWIVLPSTNVAGHLASPKQDSLLKCMLLCRLSPTKTHSIPLHTNANDFGFPCSTWVTFVQLRKFDFLFFSIRCLRDVYLEFFVMAFFLFWFFLRGRKNIWR